MNHDDRKRAGYDCLGEIVARLIGRGEDCVMDESHLTDPSFRGAFKGFCDEFLPGVEQEWIFFEEDVVACINNVYADHQGPRKGGATRLSALMGQIGAYVVPTPGSFPGHEGPRLVYRRESPKFGEGQEAEALAWLHGEIARPGGGAT